MRALLIAAAALALAAAAIALARPSGRQPVRSSLSLAEALGAGDTAGYARAFESRPFRFPDDHGAHPDFRSEWWYFTGNLEGEDGTPLGYQLTFFRSAVAPSAPPRPSAWATRQVWMAHLAVTDAGRDRFSAHDRFARGAAGLAGARIDPFRVWLEDWSASTEKTLSGEVDAGSAPDAIFPLRLRAAAGDDAIDLVVGAGKPIVLHGENGLSRKGPEEGNASFYYSFTRLPTRGTLRVGGRSYRVTGATWLDREWSTSALSEGLAGWDWFALQLSDGSELMLYHLRREDGGASPFSAGTIITPAGGTRAVAPNEFEISVLDEWRSPLDGTRYPARWRVRAPRERLDLIVEPLVAGQELNLAVRYWEGTARVTGTHGGRAVGGRAYVELTGYGETDTLTRADRPDARSAR